MKLASSIIVSLLTASHHVGAFSVVRSNTATTTSINKSRISTSLNDKIFFADEKEETTSATSSSSSSKKKKKKNDTEKDTEKDTKSKPTKLNAKDDKEEKKEEKEEEKEEEIASMTGGATSSMSGSIYDKLGFEEDNIAIGIDPDDVLEWIGNRDDIIKRFVKDNDGKLNEERAGKEADKFMMDSEMVNTLIMYERKKAAGELNTDGPAFDWFTVLVGGYLVYVVGSTVKRSLDKQNIDIDIDEDVTGAAVDAVQGAVDAVSTSVDIVQNTVLDAVHTTVPDVIQTTIDIASSAL
jgi:hypothetical protein